MMTTQAAQVEAHVWKKGSALHACARKRGVWRQERAYAFEVLANGRQDLANGALDEHAAYESVASSSGIEAVHSIDHQPSRTHARTNRRNGN
jgi:hypothetical protein